MTDILLVNPLFLQEDPVERRLMMPYFPLGLLYLAAALRQESYRVELFDAHFHSGQEAFQEALERHDPAVVGITTLVTTKQFTLRLAGMAKAHGSTVIAGGPDATGAAESYLRPGTIDLVVYDEAEETILELMGALSGRRPADLAAIQGLRYLDGEGHLHDTGPRPLIQDLDAIPFPARDMVDMEAYRRVWREHHGRFSLTLINTRGCPYSCAWCQKNVFGRVYRSRSAANSAREMRHIKRAYAPDHLRVVDDITGVNRKWIPQWHSEVLGRDAAIPFECLSRVNLMDVPTLTLLREMGCQKIYFGAESGSQKVLDAMNKGIKVRQIHQAARACREVGIKTYFFMMMGYPGEDLVDLRQSASLLRTALPDEYSSTLAYPLPGTRFYEELRERHLYDPAWGSDWNFTAENRLVFKREKYGTRFYRLAQRWLRKEWQDARQAGHATPWRRRVGTKAKLAAYRMAVPAAAFLSGGWKDLPGLRRSRLAWPVEHHPARDCRS